MDNDAKTTELNGRLRMIYAPYLQHVKNEFTSEATHLSLPILMSAKSSYFQGKQKILFITKEIPESYGKLQETDKLNPDYLMESYEKSNLCEVDESDLFIFMRMVNEKINGTPCEGYLWTSISKMSYADSTPPVGIQNRNKQGFDLLKEEIGIVKPDMIFFLTGFSYDEQIQSMYPDIKYETIKDNVAYNLSHPDLPVKSIISLQPKSLNKRSQMDTVFNAIFSEAAVSH